MDRLEAFASLEQIAAAPVVSFAQALAAIKATLDEGAPPPAWAGKRVFASARAKQEALAKALSKKERRALTGLLGGPSDSSASAHRL